MTAPIPEDAPDGWLSAIDARWPALRQRGGSLALALLLEAGLLLLLLTLGQGITGPGKPGETLTSISFTPEAEPDKPPSPEPEAKNAAAVPRPADAPRLDAPTPLSPAPVAMPSPAVVLPVAKSTPAPAAPAAPAKIGVRLRDEVSGPTGKAGPSSFGESQVVGSGPDGKPVYAARWYREPTDGELRGYLSAVGVPGWATINCRTVANFRVEDCYLLDQYPDPSRMGQAVLAASWQFKVRPPQVGGELMVGAWVRIRISYDLKRKREY